MIGSTYSVRTAVSHQCTELKQHTRESLLVYKRRIESTLCMYDAIGLTRPCDATTVNNMMKTVNQAKYDEAIKALLTALHENMKPFPSTTQELYVYLVGRVHGKKVDKTLTVHVELGKTSLNFWSRS